MIRDRQPRNRERWDLGAGQGERLSSLSRRSPVLPSFRGPRSGAGLRVFAASSMTYCAFLDECGHVDPCVAWTDPKYRECPVSGFPGFVMTAQAVRRFGTWFYQGTCEFLAFEIARSGKRRALSEKKDASLHTVTKSSHHPEPRRFTNRLLNRIGVLGGFVPHVWRRQTAPLERHDPNSLRKRRSGSTRPARGATPEHLVCESAPFR